MKKKIYITFDMDWACDDVLEVFYSYICEWGIKATINVTHETHMLDVFRKDEKIELGIHPNFNNLLNGSVVSGINASDVIAKIKGIVPDAVTMRAHSLVKSTPLTSLLAENGIKYELNSYVIPQRGMVLQPYMFEKVWQIPFIFEDDLYMQAHMQIKPEEYLSQEFDVSRVFNFHPIHLFLNCEKLERYHLAKIYYHDFGKLKQFVNKGNENGMYNYFCSLIECAYRKGYVFETIKEIE